MKTNPHPDTALPAPVTLSAEEFLALGAETTAFVKQVALEDGSRVYGIFSSYGQPLGFAETLAAAHATVRQNELDPVSVH